MRQKVRSRSTENATGREGQGDAHASTRVCIHASTRIAHANEGVQRQRVSEHAKTTSVPAEMRGGGNASTPVP